MYALKSGAWLCGQKFTQYFSFKIHLFLQNVLQNLVRTTSKSVTSRCFCYIYLKIFHILVYLLGITLQVSPASLEYILVCRNKHVLNFANVVSLCVTKSLGDKEMIKGLREQKFS
jgi:hypothetical protein